MIESTLDSFTSVVIPIIIKLEEDVRERILFIAHLYIDTTIHDYTPSEEDIDYPDKLYQFYAQRHRADFSIYSVWYTPVQKVLRVLSLLYTCVDVSAFQRFHVVHHHGRYHSRGSGSTAGGHRSRHGDDHLESVAHRR